MIDPLILRIKERLNGNLPGRSAQELMAPNVRFNGHQFPDPVNSKQSGVLILLFPDMQKEWTTVFIERTPYGPHGGQISLPGGKMEDTDADLSETALREANEEIGVKREEINILGGLTPLYVPHSNFKISPFVGYTCKKPALFKNDSEVNSIISLRLNDLFDQRNKGINRFYRTGFSVEAPVYKTGDHLIWGATAMIMSELEVILSK
jgi:8-oxo-dGTP pyrophosphatase MutT (NUDIX family)